MFVCEVVSRGMRLAGLSVSCSISEFPGAAVRVESELFKRKREFEQLKSPNICYSPHYEKGNLATYWACFEVEESATVPHGATAFKLYEQKYAKVTCDGDSMGKACQWVYKWIEEQGFQRNREACEIECYYKSPVSDDIEEKVEIWVPIH